MQWNVSVLLLCGLLKAKQLGTKQLDEDGLFKLIESLPAKKSKYELIAEKEAAKVQLAKAYTNCFLPATDATVVIEIRYHLSVFRDFVMWLISGFHKML